MPLEPRHPLDFDPFAPVPNMRSVDLEGRVGKALTADGIVIGPDQTLTSGLDVTVIRDDGTRWLTRTRSGPWQLGDGTWVILLEGKAGGYALDRVRRRREGDGT